MRDYKNVKVPKSYRGRSGGASVKRVRPAGASARKGKGGAAVKGLLMKVLVVVLIAGAAALAWQGYRTVARAELFLVAGVDIKGVRQTDEAELRDIAAAFTGQNIFRADIDDAVRRARANPWVKEARIHRRLPNRITMVVVERTPQAILDTGEARFLMDDEGAVIERLDAARASAWPLPVIAIRGCRARPGEQVTAEALTEAMLLIAEIRERGGWRPEALTIKADSPESLSVVYAEHEFKIGSGRYGEKLRRLSEVMADVNVRGLTVAYVDVRPERQAAVMVKNSRVKGPGSRGKGKSQ